MKYKNFLIPNFLIFFLIIFCFNKTTQVNAHTDWSILHGPHEPKVCILDKDRTLAQKTLCRDKLKRHKMCNFDAVCATEKLKKLQDELDVAIAKIAEGGTVNCKGLTFSHVVLSNANIYQETSGNSKVIQKVKKGQKISFVGSTDKKNWIIVVPKAKTCKIGYINEKNIGLSTSSGTSTSANPEPPTIKKDKNIKITFPKWKKVGELITVDQSGFFEIDGFVNKDLAINKVIINYDGDDEEMILGSDGSFNATLQIENTLDVRITTYKNATQIGKALVFKVAVE
tara:strand:+ start:2117 stop:2968 length:852 start_codon:yes stop_codon:yes gene_type:complete